MTKQCHVLNIAELDRIISQLNASLDSKNDQSFFSVLGLLQNLEKLRDALIKAEREKTANLAPEIRYLKDPWFKQLVDMLENYIQLTQFSPSEIREAAMLAVIRYETRNPRTLIARAEEELNKMNRNYE